MQTLDEIDVLGDGVGGHDRHEIAVLDHVGQFVMPVARVHRHDHGPAQRRGEEHLDELGTGVHQDADVVPRPYAERAQAAGARECARGQFAVREALLGEDQCEAVRMPVGSRQQQIADGRDLDPQRRQILAADHRGIAGPAAGCPRLRRPGVPALACG
jgi:hypothetical protein